MGSFRSTPQLNKHTNSGKTDNYNYSVTNMCGWRMYMQDAHLSVSPFSNKKFGLFAVFDGHGGAECSAFVQRHFPKQLENNENFKKGDYQKALKETFLKMDQILFSQQGKNQIINIQKQMKQKTNGVGPEQPSHAGCTANVILITPQFIYCANSGDSRAVASINNKTFALSEDHKPEDQKQTNRIRKAGGSVTYGRVNGNLNLSRALGDLQYKGDSNLTPQQQIITANPDILKIKNQNIDFIIMGCDGIWQEKSNQQMVRWVSKKIYQQKKDNSVIVQQLLDQLVAKDGNRQYGMDNMSAILITFNKK